MVAVPADTPETIPVEDPTVAIPVDPEVQVPPPASDKVVVEPAHTDPVPVIDEGEVFIVTTVEVKHPVGSV